MHTCVCRYTHTVNMYTPGSVYVYSHMYIHVHICTPVLQVYNVCVCITSSNASPACSAVSLCKILTFSSLHALADSSINGDNNSYLVGFRQVQHTKAAWPL